MVSIRPPQPGIRTVWGGAELDCKFIRSSNNPCGGSLSPAAFLIVPFVPAGASRNMTDYCFLMH